MSASTRRAALRAHHSGGGSSLVAVDHAGACASAGANIVDAQIYTTTDGRALDTIAITREYDRDEDEGRRATRIGDMIEDVLEGKLRLPEAVARRAAGRGKTRRSWSSRK